MFDQAPLTVNDPEVTATLTEAFTDLLGADRVIEPPRILGREDFSDIANGVGRPVHLLALRRCRSRMVLRC